MAIDEETPEEGSIFDAFDDPADEGVIHDIETPDDGFAPQNNEGPIEGDTQTGSEDFQQEDADTLPSYDTNTNSDDSAAPFSPAKTPASTILNQGPHKLNKQLILYVLFGILVIFIIFSMFITPLLKKKQQAKTKKPDMTAVTAVDYSALIPKKAKEPIPADSDDDEIILQNLPPVDPAYQYVPPPETPPPVMATGGGYSDRPDTRGDHLQSKSISGIKGITPSQRQYLSATGGPYQGAAPPMQDNPYAQFGMPTKEDYTAQMLAQYSQTAPSFNAMNSYSNQNDQSGKMNFYNSGRENAGNGVWLGPATIWQGTIFEATLTSNINTDLPGEVTALIAKNVYSSLDGRYLLIPQNSRLFGSYNSSISYSQSRVQVGWHTLIRPDGYAINLGNMIATDAQGAAGLKGFINDHPFQYLKALGLMTAFNIISGEFENTATGTDNLYVQNIMADSQSIVRTLGSKLIDRAMDVQPTITIKAGLKINIVANTNLALPPLKPYDVTMPYHK